MCNNESTLSKNINEDHYDLNSTYSFKLDKIIGKGHFSVVYKGTVLKENRSVAVKKINILEMVGENTQEACMKEINLLQQMDHSNIIKCLDSFIENNELYIVLELAEAGDLLCTIEKFRRCSKLIPEKTIWKYFLQICNALEHMHSKSIMHRDIKPANVFIAPNGVIKLGDLGLGRFFSPNTQAALTSVGTPYYLSPERIQEKQYTFSSDIWSLGCLLYEMAALQPPFYANNNTNLYILCKRIEGCNYCPVPSEMYSKKMKSLIASCIVNDSNARPDISSIQKIVKKIYEPDSVYNVLKQTVLNPIQSNYIKTPRI